MHIQVYELKYFIYSLWLTQTEVQRFENEDTINIKNVNVLMHAIFIWQ
jgi:hypothetical protein